MRKSSRQALEEMPFLPGTDTSTLSQCGSSLSTYRHSWALGFKQGTWIHLFLILLYSGCTLLYIISFHNEHPSLKTGMPPKSEVLRLLADRSSSFHIRGTQVSNPSFPAICAKQIRRQTWPGAGRCMEKSSRRRKYQSLTRRARTR